MRLVRWLLKLVLVMLVPLLMSTSLQSQTIEFFDDFENGSGNWTFTGNWGLSSNAFTGLYGMTESPMGNYLNMETSYATMDTSVDLSLATDAYVEFAATYNIEYSFDYLYVDASIDNGASWINVTSFTGDSAWWRYSFSIGGFVGYSQVKVRFRFSSDQALNYEGFSADNFQIVSYTEDVTPPMILHQGPAFFEGELDTFFVQAEIIDISGVASANLHYWVDSVFQGVLPGYYYNSNDWMFSIPPQSPGSWVSYYIVASDLATTPNTDTSKVYEYIAGNHILYDNGSVDFVQNVGQIAVYQAAAVKIDLNGLTTVVAALIRTYTDPFIVNGPIQFHIWSDNNGVPGSDLVVPFYFTPEANPDSPHKMTRLDLRPYVDSLAGLSGSVFVGYTSPTSQHYTPVSSPGNGNHSYFYNGITWSLSFYDLHFRLVTTPISGAPNALFSLDLSADPQISFTDLSTGNPINWEWDFDDGTILPLTQNPVYVFNQNGIYHVCLTVNNGISTDTYCEFVEISNCTSPVAGYTFITDYSPEILFQDTSTGYPTNWFWDFDDNGNTWSYLNPMYTFTHNDTFTVCLVVGNNYGFDTICQTIIIDDYTAPQTMFGYSLATSPYIQFYDMTSSGITNSPDSWSWNFGDGSPLSPLQEPYHLFPDNGVYNVCLTTANTYGSTTYCNLVYINTFTAPEAFFTYSINTTATVSFHDQSSDSIQNQPTYWNWSFGDGATSTLQNPSHSYAQNGYYEVCLIVGNAYGADTICQTISFQNYMIPVASFTISSSLSPLILFIDNSNGLPTQWKWNFGDGSNLNLNENPAHTYSTNGIFSVCLEVSNYLGSDTLCQNININYYTAPVSNFSWLQTGDGEITFTDISTMYPTDWTWSFGDGVGFSFDQHPVYSFATGGEYEVCLEASNTIGVGSMICKMVTVQHSAIPDAPGESVFTLFPNPTSGNCSLQANENQLSDCQIVVRDMQGRVLNLRMERCNEQLEIETGGLPAGIYQIQLQSGDIYDSFKLIKIHE
ncbi:MAG: PKD domain-containing protein [Bacteroidales bacterium]|nr:PKD domain-containing protein [Bacteroidales bacterium]